MIDMHGYTIELQNPSNEKARYNVPSEDHTQFIQLKELANVASLEYEDGTRILVTFYIDGSITVHANQYSKLLNSEIKSDNTIFIFN